MHSLFTICRPTGAVMMLVLTCSNRAHEWMVMQEQDNRVIIDSDDDSNGSSSCLIVKKEKGEYK